MFLNELNREEAIAFMHLISEFVMADEEVNIEEKKLIDKFFKEMNIEDELDVLTLDEALDELKKSSQRIRNIVYFELIRLGLVDSDYRISEVEFLEDISGDLGITRIQKIKYANYFYKYSEDEFLDHEDAMNEANLLF
ncbi:hypothetical protein [Clostridium massiliamazoniense]|uniref:hypothetical protein n=1 Tax=Clostridium massiliamazoniense TaxID=1347366 RepID=UPI0006D82187|nr:hypothetical protein [Clostridium massiliamazoniense]